MTIAKIIEDIIIYRPRKDQDNKMVTDIEDEKHAEEEVDRCESCLQILDPASPLPSIRLTVFCKDNESISKDEKTAILDPRVCINN